ncbi:MAG: SEC-C metal-binding domain-containing protein, partial [Hyphomonadaceae bacterium]
LLPIVMAFYNDIARAIGRPRTYVPRLDADVDGLAVWELWASGFGRALDLRPWAWSVYEDMAEDDTDAIPFRLLSALATAAEEPGGSDLHEDLQKFLVDRAEAIIGAGVESLNRTRLTALQAERPTKIGRNDPCPCGSGKKYKKCCLQAQNP